MKERQQSTNEPWNLDSFLHPLRVEEGSFNEILQYLEVPFCVIFRQHNLQDTAKQVTSHCKTMCYWPVSQATQTGMFYHPFACPSWSWLAPLVSGHVERRPQRSWLLVGSKSYCYQVDFTIVAHLGRKFFTVVGCSLTRLRLKLSIADRADVPTIRCSPLL